MENGGVDCLLDGQCCPSAYGSCTLYFGREGVPYVEWMAVSSDGTGVVRLVSESGDVWEVQS